MSGELKSKLSVYIDQQKERIHSEFPFLIELILTTGRDGEVVYEDSEYNPPDMKRAEILFEMGIFDRKRKSSKFRRDLITYSLSEAGDRIYKKLREEPEYSGKVHVQMHP